MISYINSHQWPWRLPLFQNKIICKLASACSGQMNQMCLFIEKGLILGLFSNVNISMRVLHATELVRPVASARIMSGPIRPCASIKVVGGTREFASAVEQGPVANRSWKFRRCWCSLAGGCHLSYNSTANTSVLPLDKISNFRIANQPLVDVALYQNLLANLFPKWEV